MEGTPRLRSAFPSTPQADRRRAPPQYGGNASSTQRKPTTVPDIASLKPAASAKPSNPLIPEHILDAPSQRLFAFSLWVLLQTWKIFDFVTLQESEEQSFLLFMKWLAIDGAFFFGLPSMRIPWLEWSSSTMMLLFAAHAVSDGMLMFRIPIPLGAGFAAVGRSIWGAYELAISERSVNPEFIKFNDSLILGRQIIHILPEGSAILNPDRGIFCIDETKPVARLPIRINSTNPVAMELLRVDLDTDANETISISKAQIKTMHKDASRLITYSEHPHEPKTLYFAVKKPGLYALQKVVDETNLEVARKQLAHTAVVSCPKAAILPSSPNKCKGELSDIMLEVTGTPPLKVDYIKVINKFKHEAMYDGIMPDDYFSPLVKQDHGASAIPKRIDTAWAKTQTIRIPLKESLGTAGQWKYSITSVKDGFGNIYSGKDHDEKDKSASYAPHLHQVITVHERPTVKFQGCTPQNPKKLAKGKQMAPPLDLGSTGHGSSPLPNTNYDIDFAFSPGNGGVEGEESVGIQQTFSMKSSNPKSIKEPGLYTITNVSTEYCQGEVLEPASCLLQNPPEPTLSINKEDIYDKCAGSSIGLRVDLDMIGTPPFQIRYRVSKMDGSESRQDVTTVKSLRGQIKLLPEHAGHYRYEFFEIRDAVYGPRPLQGYSLEQTVKPSVSARFANPEKRSLCIEETASFDIDLQGEGPFKLEYELVHGGKRTKYTKENIDQRRVHIETESLREGGEYTLALISVTDGMGCKEFLDKEDTKTQIAVRHTKPKASFGHIEGKRNVQTLENSPVRLPLRLEGLPPWTIKYLDRTGQEHTLVANRENDLLPTKDRGVFELQDVRDKACPGIVDESAKKFEISWVPRPELRIAPSEKMEHKENTLVRHDVCERDEDSVEILFKGSAPFRAQVMQQNKAAHGTAQPKKKELHASGNVGTLQMETNHAGLYEYRITDLKDHNYDPSAKHFTPITIRQRVHARPSAAFETPGKTYSYCSVESDGEEVIPVTLHGEPPFELEVEIKHHATARPETVSLTGINTHKHNIRVPHSRLQLGKSTVSLRRVQDSRGCARTLDSATPRVQIAVHDAPTITPLEVHTDFCVGERLNFALSGAAPFNIFYTFEGAARKAVASTSTFRRLAEKPGSFVITGVQDSASPCRSSTNLTSYIHGLPSARVSSGREGYVDIHEGSAVEILFEFGGTPPFEFTYTRSSNTARGAAKPGTVLDMKSEVSELHSMRILAHEEGTYEVVAIKDRYCAYAKPGVKLDYKEAQKRLGY